MESFKIILLSSEQDIAQEAETLSRLFDSGLSLFHLRKPGWSIEQAKCFVDTIPKKFHNRIVLHSHFQLSKTFPLKGIHLNEANKPLFAQLGQYNIISASFHSLPEIEANVKPYQYTFISPVFDSISKPGYHAKFSFEEISKDIFAMRQNKPFLPGIIALGGVNAGNIISIKNSGFSGAALLGSVWSNENPLEAFRKIQSIAAA